MMMMIDILYTNHGSLNYLDPGPAIHSDWDTHVWKEGKGPKPDPVSSGFGLGSSAGIQWAWRQPGNGWPLYILDDVLQDLTVNRVSIKFIVLNLCA
jgi:hypothetical protein